MYLTKIQALLIGVESVRGVAETLVATNAVEAENVTIRFVEDVKEREVHKRSLGNAKHIKLNRYTEIEFDYLLRVTGTPADGIIGTPEKINPMFRAAGLTPTYNAAVSIHYAFTNAPTDTVTIWAYTNGLRVRTYGAVADCSIRWVSGDFAYCHFVFRGYYVAPDASAIPADIEDSFSTRAPVPCVGLSPWPYNQVASTDIKGVYCFTADVTEDLSGNAHTLTNNGTVLPVDAGMRGIGATFVAASTQYLSIADTADFDFGATDFTLWGWIKHPDTAGGAVVICDRVDAAGTGWRLSIDANGKLSLYLSDDNGATNDTMISATAIDDDAWHFFIVVKNGATDVTIYIDNPTSSDSNTAIVNAAGSLTGGDNPMWIGANKAGSNYLNGELLGFNLTTADLENDAAPVAAATARDRLWRWMHDYSLREMEMQFNNEIFVERSESGITDFRIVQRKPVARVKYEHPAIADRDLYSEAMVNNPSLGWLETKIGESTANSQVIIQANVQPKTVSRSSVDGIEVVDIDLGLYETTGNIDDQLKITFK